MIAHEKGFKFHAHILARILVTFQGLKPFGAESLLFAQPVKLCRGLYYY